MSAGGAGAGEAGAGRADAPSYAELAERFRPVFARIAEGAVERETTRTLPHEPVEWLSEAGFLAVRVPVSHGGGGASIGQLIRLFVELAEADSNLPQALRAHFGFVEERLAAPDSPERDTWLRRVTNGAVIGNATTETGESATGAFQTRIDTAGERWTISGTKHYSTGSLFADWIAVGVSSDADRSAFALVRAGDAGIDLVDDWNGFGQRLTASGTTRLSAVPVEPQDVFWHDEREPGYAIAFYQLVLLAALAGVARAAARDAADYVRTRRRAFSHGIGDTPAADPLVQSVVGTVDALAYAAEATVSRAADALERINRTRGVRPLEQADLDEAELEVSRAHVAVVETVLRATTLLFEVGGASTVDAGRALDRHWRNARTISVHNPVIYKARAVGDHVVNGADLTFAWTVGTRA